MAPTLNLLAGLGGSSNVCNSLLFKGVQPLADSPAAQAFCSAKYPVAPTCTTTVNAAVQPTAAPKIPTPKSGILTEAEVPYLLQQLERLANQYVSTACSCIATPSCKTVCFKRYLQRGYNRLTCHIDHSPKLICQVHELDQDFKRCSIVGTACHNLISPTIELECLRCVLISPPIKLEYLYRIDQQLIPACRCDFCFVLGSSNIVIINRCTGNQLQLI